MSLCALLCPHTPGTWPRLPALRAAGPVPAQTSSPKARLFGSGPLPLSAGMCDQQLRGSISKATAGFPNCPGPCPLYKW